MNHLDDLDSEIEKGKLGENFGLNMGLGEFSDYLCGIQKGRYDLIGGNTGTGKTAFVDCAYVINPLNYLLTREGKETGYSYKIFYQSIEIPPKRKLAKWVCAKLFFKYGIIISYKEILSFGKNTITEEVYAKYKEVRSELEEILDRVSFITSSDPKAATDKAKSYAVNNGSFKEYFNHNTGIREEVYVPNDPKEIVSVISDHIGLFRKPGLTMKQSIDSYSDSSRFLRNVYGYNTIPVSQFNRAIGDIKRRSFEEITPQLEDFKESGAPSEDADTVLALFDPARYNLKQYYDYNVSAMNKRFRMMFILKNRDGEAGIRVGFKLIGENGTFIKIPKASDFKDNDVLYEKINGDNYGR